MLRGKECSRFRHGNSTKQWDSIQASSETRQVEVFPERLSESVWNLRVRVAPAKLPIGFFHDSVRFTLLKDNKPINSSYEFNVSARVHGSLQAIPNSFYLGCVKSSEVFTKEFDLSSDSEDLEKVVFEEDSPSIKATTFAPRPKHLTVCVHIIAPSTDGVFHRRLFAVVLGTTTKLEVVFFGFVGSNS